MKIALTEEEVKEVIRLYVAEKVLIDPSKKDITVKINHYESNMAIVDVKDEVIEEVQNNG